MEIEKRREKISSRIRKFLRRNFSGAIRRIPVFAAFLRVVLDQKSLVEVFPTIKKDVIHCAETLCTKKATILGVNQLPDQTYPVPGNWIVSLDHAFYYLQRRKIGVVTDDRILLSDLSYSNDKGKNHPIFLKSYLPQAYEIDGAAAVVAGPGGNDFYHYFSEVLYMYYLYDKADIKIDYYITHTDKPFHKAMLDLFKIPPEKIVSVTDHPAVRAQRLVVTNVAHLAPFRKGYIRFIRRKAGVNKKKNGTKRIYISRAQQGTRSVINETEIFACLSAQGFVKYTLENMDMGEQITLFSEAEYIVSPHGAGLVHLLFVPENTNVLELFHDSYKNQCFRLLAQQLGLRYKFLVDRETAAVPGLIGIQNMLIALEEMQTIISKI